MKLTKDWLSEHHACEEGLIWFGAQQETDWEHIVKKLMLEKRYGWTNWLIIRLMTRKQKICYAIFAARQVLGIFEKKYPKDDRPRKAIEAAEKCLEDDSEQIKNAAAAAASAAASAVYAVTAYAADAADAAYAAAYAAYAAAYAADAAYAVGCGAAYAAADAAADAAYAAYAAYAAADAKEKMQIKILVYGLNLLEEAT